MLKTQQVDIQSASAAPRNGLLAWLRSRYTRQGLWSLFLMCAFPLHVWAFILIFRDMSWVADRSNAWDALGVAAYGLLFALVESVLVFVLMVVLGYLVPGRWSAEQRLYVLTVLILLLSLWAILEQLPFLTGLTLPGWLLSLLGKGGHPLRTLYVAATASVGITLAVPAWIVLHSTRFQGFVRVLIEKLSMLSMFYLAVDVLAVAILVVRNV